MIPNLLPVLALLLLSATASLAAPVEALQILFLIDDSSSMDSPAGDPAHPRASRWDLVQLAHPEWMNRLSRDVLVGALSVGGVCGGNPQIRLPAGTDRKVVSDAIASSRPNGATNLNAALQLAGSLFNPAVRGGRRIVLLSDGMNTCPPDVPTCELLRALHRDHGIVVDVVAWVTDPGMRDAARCWADATGGTFTPAATLASLASIPLPEVDPLRHALLALGFLTLLFAGRALYRHGHHALGWEPHAASAAAALLLLSGAVGLYLVLFMRAGPAAALPGAASLAAMFLLAHRQGRQAAVVVLALSLVPGYAGAVALEPLLPTQARVQGAAPLYHHIIVVDISGSVSRSLPEMIAFLRRYYAMAVIAGEPVTLIVFGADGEGQIREIGTFSAEAGGASFQLGRLLNDVDLPGESMTYFRPLADYLNAFLAKKVRLAPVLLVLSDGESDANKRGGLKMHEIPFSTFGTRGVFTVPGAKKWRVAVQGGAGLQLQPLFRSAGPASAGSDSAQALAVNPKLVDPDVVVRCPEPLVLHPGWNPLSNERHGELKVSIQSDPIPRSRTLVVELRLGEQRLELGRFENRVVGSTPESFTFPVVANRTADILQAEVCVTLFQPDGSKKTVYLDGPATVPFAEETYLQAHGWVLGAGAATALALLLGFVSIQRARRRADLARPEVVETFDGESVALTCGVPQALGGEGCSLVLAGVGPGVRLATMEWAGVRGEIRLSPEPGLRMRIDGRDASSPAPYRLGRLLELIEPDGKSHEVTLHQGRLSDVGLVAGMPALASSPFEDGSLGASFGGSAGI